MYSAVIYGVLALYLLYRMLLFYFPEKTSKASIWLILVSANLFWYIVFEPSISHVNDFFTFVAFINLFLRCAKSHRMIDYISMAALGGLNILVRTQNIVTIGLFSILLVIREISERDGLRHLITYSAALIISILPLPLTNIYLYGSNSQYE